MKMKTLTIAIPTYNEEKNLDRIVSELLSQKIGEKVKLDSILVILDGCSDHSEQVVKKIKNPKVRYLINQDRKGKAFRMNESFGTINTDLLVVIDADVHLSDNLVISQLIAPLLDYSDPAYSSGLCVPKHPKNLISSISYAGVGIWKTAESITKENSMYLSEGQLRAFNRKFYKQIQFPISSADDVYPYLFAKSKGFKFFYANRSKVYYTLPHTFRDYLKQQLRYLQSYNIQSKSFDQKILGESWTIGTTTKLLALIKYFPSNPVYTSLYLLMSLVVRVIKMFNEPQRTSLWPQLYSTK